MIKKIVTFVTRILFIFVIALSVNACSKKKAEDLKSPCVSKDGGPCDKRPVNNWLNEKV